MAVPPFASSTVAKIPERDAKVTSGNTSAVRGCALLTRSVPSNVAAPVMASWSNNPLAGSPASVNSTRPAAVCV
jgi:hypothetical protein